MNIFQFFPSDCLFMERANFSGDLKCAIAAHEFKRRQVLSGGPFWQPRNRVVEDPFVVLVDAESCARFLFRLCVLPNAEAAVSIDAPQLGAGRQFNQIHLEDAALERSDIQVWIVRVEAQHV